MPGYHLVLEQQADRIKGEHQQRFARAVRELSNALNEMAVYEPEAICKFTGGQAFVVLGEVDGDAILTEDIALSLKVDRIV